MIMSKISFFGSILNFFINSSVDIVIENGKLSVEVTGTFSSSLKGLAFLLQLHEDEHVLAELSRFC